MTNGIKETQRNLIRPQAIIASMIMTFIDELLGLGVRGGGSDPSDHTLTGLRCISGWEGGHLVYDDPLLSRAANTTAVHIGRGATRQAPLNPSTLPSKS